MSLLRSAPGEPLSLADRLDRTREADRDLHAFVHLPDRVPEPGNGPLSGVTFGVKDIIDTVDMPTGHGSPIDPDHRPDADALIVARLRALGGTVLGKTHTTEFAWRQPGPTVNPHDARHTPGGSSSGSAAGVAAGLVDAALGTQTVGSVIRPAAYCGVAGFKPSYGWTPRTGVHPLAWTLDHLGLFAGTVALLERVFDLCVSRDPSDPHGYLPDDAGRDDAAPFRIGIVDPPAWDRVSPAQKSVRAACAERMREDGMEVVSFDLDPMFESSLSAIDTILKVEAGAVHRDRIARHPDKVSSWLTGLVDTGADIPAKEYAEALVLRLALRTRFAETMEQAGLDAILTVPALDIAPEGLAETGDASMCAPWTLIGAPAISLPVSRGARNLPLGIQLVSPWLADRTLLRVASATERVLDYS